MSMFKRGCVVLLVIVGSACGGSNRSPSAPSTTPTPAPAPTPPRTSTFHVTGIVTEDDGSPVTGASVTILNQSVSGRTDGSGFYSIDFEVNAGAVGLGWVSAESAGHDMSYHYLIPASGSQDVSQNIRLYRIKRITAGESTSLTVAPGDTSCGDNDQFICRTLHIVAPTDGLMTIEAVPTPSTANAGLEITGRGSTYHCCPLTASVAVIAGTEVIANVGMWWTSTASQSFALNTSLVRP